MALWEERERRRAEILARADEAGVALARGEGTVITPETMDTLAEDVKRRGRARLDAENAARRRPARRRAARQAVATIKADQRPRAHRSPA
jgi:hypothetical protein